MRVKGSFVLRMGEPFTFSNLPIMREVANAMIGNSRRAGYHWVIGAAMVDSLVAENIQAERDNLLVVGNLVMDRRLQQEH